MEYLLKVVNCRNWVGQNETELIKEYWKAQMRLRKLKDRQRNLVLYQQRQ